MYVYIYIYVYYNISDTFITSPYHSCQIVYTLTSINNNVISHH